MININHLLVKHKDFVCELKNLKINKGDKLAILGRNGAGKTTLLEALLKLKKANILDVNYSNDLRINAVLQDANFDSDFKVKEILKMYHHLFKISNNQLEEIIKKLELNNLLERKYGKLSTGEKQKIKICVSMLNTPNLLLLDEVTTSLDIVWQKKIIKILTNYLKTYPDTILLMVTHNLKDAFNLCDQALLLVRNEAVKNFNLRSNKKNAEKQILEVLGE